MKLDKPTEKRCGQQSVVNVLLRTKRPLSHSRSNTRTRRREAVKKKGGKNGRCRGGVDQRKPNPALEGWPVCLVPRRRMPKGAACEYRRAECRVPYLTTTTTTTIIPPLPTEVTEPVLVGMHTSTARIVDRSAFCQEEGGGWWWALISGDRLPFGEGIVHDAVSHGGGEDSVEVK